VQRCGRGRGAQEEKEEKEEKERQHCNRNVDVREGGV
jgi:hypothetical protein